MAQAVGLCQQGFCGLKAGARASYHWVGRDSSVVEQRFRKARVGGSSPSPGSTF